MVPAHVKQLNFLLAADGRIRWGLMAAIASICETLPKSQRAKITVVDGGIPADMITRLKNQYADGTKEIEFVPFRWPAGCDAPALEGSRLTYARLCAADLIDSDVCVYVDADIVVTGDLSPLFERARSDPSVPVWAARNRPDDSFHGQLARQNTELVAGVPESELYFNAGFLVINLARWRELNVAKLGFDLAAKYQFISHDQDALNVLFRGQWRQLEDRWNYQLIDRTSFPADTAVLHYSGRNKPWQCGYARHVRAPFKRALKAAGWPHWRAPWSLKEWLRNSRWRPFFSRMQYRLRRARGLEGIERR
ncbi:MAG TPA: glycosyltransferase [Opitutaceae bacterium]